MDLETVIQNEVRKRKTNNTYCVESEKDVYRWSYLQSRDKDTNIENKCMDTKGKMQRWDKLGDWDWHRYTSDTMYKTYN